MFLNFFPFFQNGTGPDPTILGWVKQWVSPLFSCNVNNGERRCRRRRKRRRRRGKVTCGCSRCRWWRWLGSPVAALWASSYSMQRRQSLCPLLFFCFPSLISLVSISIFLLYSFSLFPPFFSLFFSLVFFLFLPLCFFLLFIFFFLFLSAAHLLFYSLFPCIYRQIHGERGLLPLSNNGIKVGRL